MIYQWSYYKSRVEFIYVLTKVYICNASIDNPQENKDENKANPTNANTKANLKTIKMGLKYVKSFLGKASHE